MTIAETFQQRYERLIGGTLEGLAHPTDTIAFSVTGTRVSFPCQLVEDPEDEHWHERAAISIVWMIDREGGFHWAGSVDVPIEDHAPTPADIQTVLGEQWARMSFDHQSELLSDLDIEMDEIAEAEEAGS